MGEKCGACGEDGVVYNIDQRCEICRYCGVVGDVTLVSGLAAARDKDLGTFCDADTVTKFRVGKHGVRKGVCTVSNVLATMGKTGIQGREQLLQMLATFEVASAASEEALLLYRDCYRKRLLQREARALAGGVLMYILRREGRSLTFREIASACASTVKDVGKQYKQVMERIVQRGGPAPLTPSVADILRQSIEMYASKFERSFAQSTGLQTARAEFQLSTVIAKASDLADWVDQCTMISRNPAQSFALSAFFLAFKAVNVERCFRLTFTEFNNTHNFIPMSGTRQRSFSKISPAAIIRAVCQVVNVKSRAGMLVTSSNFFFMFDIILQLKSFFAFRITDSMTTVEGDIAFEAFREAKETLEKIEMEGGDFDEDETDLTSAISDSELSQYILSQQELSRRHEAVLREQVLRVKIELKKEEDPGEDPEQKTPAGLASDEDALTMNPLIGTPAITNAPPTESAVPATEPSTKPAEAPSSETAKDSGVKKHTKPRLAIAESALQHPKKRRLKQLLQEQMRLDPGQLDFLENSANAPQDATTMLALFRGEQLGDEANDEEHFM